MTDATGAPPPVAPFSEAAVTRADENWAAIFKPSASATTAEKIAQETEAWMARIRETRAGASAGGTAAPPLEDPAIERAYLNLLNFGLTPASIAEMRASAGASAAERQLAQTYKNQLMADKSKQQKLFDGDAEVRKQWAACNFILSLPVVKKGA